MPKALFLPGPIAAIAVLSLLLSGCNWEVSRLPRPSPTPTPGPGPTPGPTPRPTPLPTSTAVASFSTLPSQVVLNNADLLTEATTSAAGEATRFEQLVTRVAAAPLSAAASFPEALEAFDQAQQSYQQAEVAVFYVDPESVDELLAQPDPLGVAGAGEAENAVARITAGIEELSLMVTADADRDTLGEVLVVLRELREGAKHLREGLDALAAAWDEEVDESFRQRYFLSDPEASVARIFQGLLAQSGDVLSERSPAPEVLAAGAAALRDHYLGITSRWPGGLGVHDLVYAAAPAQAMATYAAIARAVALAEAWQHRPTDEEIPRQLPLAWAEVTRQLEWAAEAVGVRVIDTAPEDPAE